MAGHLLSQGAFDDASGTERHHAGKRLTTDERMGVGDGARFVPAFGHRPIRDTLGSTFEALSQ
jgi:hypothetical protein